MLLPLLAAFGGGQVLVVDDDPTPGAQFSQIADALAVAGDDDVILVREGVYDGFSLLGQGASIFGVDLERPLVTGSIKIGGQDLGQPVVIDGLRVVHAGVGMVVSGTKDSVWLEDLTIEVSAQIAFPLPGLVIDDAADVVCADVQVVPSKGEGVGGNWGALVTDSILHAYDSLFEASTALEPSPVDLAGLRAVGSFVFASGTRFVGADGLAATDDGAGGCQPAESGHPALVLDDSSLLATEMVTLDCSLEPGTGGAEAGACSPAGDGEPFVILGSSTLDEVDVVLPARHYDVTSIVSSGQVAWIGFEGTPGEVVANYLGIVANPVFVPAFNGSFGSFGSIAPIAAGVLDASGTLAVPLSAQVPPGYAFVTLYAQGLFASDVDGIVLGTPRAVLFVDL